jgi:hypothetical protein
MEAATRGTVVPVFKRIFSDQLTPVLAYRCLVKEDERDAPSFLFESIEHGEFSSHLVSETKVEYFMALSRLRLVLKELRPWNCEDKKLCCIYVNSMTPLHSQNILWEKGC